MILRFSVSILIIIVHLVRIVYFFSLKNKILTSVYLEVEMEFAGRLKKIRIKLIMIGICLIFLGGYSLIQEWKDQKRIQQKKYLISIRMRFLKKIYQQMRSRCISFRNPEKYRLEQPKNLYPSMNQGSVLNEKIKISKEIEKLKKI